MIQFPIIIIDTLSRTQLNNQIKNFSNLYLVIQNIKTTINPKVTSSI